MLCLLNVHQGTLLIPPFTVITKGLFETTYKLCLQTYFEGLNLREYFESYDFAPQKYKYQNLWTYHISVFMFDLRMINMSSECKYD